MTAPADTAIDTPEQMRGYAIQLATRHAFHVFPVDHPSLPRCRGIGKRHDPATCDKRGKHPTVPFATWATDDAERLATPRYFGGKEPRNVGIACGPSGVVVVDEDEAGELERFERNTGIEVPATFTVATRDGRRHLYYGQRDDVEPLGNSDGALRGYAVDVRGDGGFVVGPGSTHATGHVYTITDDRDPVVIPRHLYDALAKRPASTEGADGNTEAKWWADGPIPAGAKGGHHKALVAASGWCRRMGMPRDLAVPTIRDVFHRLTDHTAEPYTWDEALDVLDDIYDRYPAGYRFDEKFNPNLTDAPGSNGHGPTADTGGPVGVDAEVTGAYTGPISREHRVAETFVTTYRDTMRYAHGLGWLVWRSHVWVEDEDGTAERAAMHVIREALRAAVDIKDEDKRKRALKELFNLDKAAGVNATLTMARSMLPIAIAHSALDTDPWLLNTPSATINLKTGEVGPADPRNLITKSTNVGIAPAGTPSPLWDKFLNRVLPNLNVRSYIQRVLGSAVVGRVQTQNLPIWTGAGANGKGTMRDAVKYALGSYCIEVDPDIILSTSSDKHPTELMDLRGARLVFCSETNEGRKFNAARMKRLTGGDPVRARRIARDPVEFDPSHQIVMLTNRQLPEVSANDPAVWRRIQATPWEVNLPEKEWDGELGDKLQAEGPQILRWILEGWIAYRTGGLQVPDKVRQRTAKYRAANDIVGQFIEERCTVRAEFKAPSSDLYRAYKNWCNDNGHRSDASNVFADAMQTNGFTKKKTEKGMRWSGLRIDAAHYPPKDAPPRDEPPMEQP